MAHVCGVYRYNQCRAHVVLLVELEAKIDKLEHERAALLGRGNPQGGGPSGGGGPAVHHQPSAGGGGHRNVDTVLRQLAAVPSDVQIERLMMCN